jgi:hypothetical protein
MVMARQGKRDRGKERFWRRLLGQWRRSGLSVRDFCGAQEVSEPSFYGWRRTLALRDQQAAEKQQGQKETNAPTVGGHERSTDGPPLFVPVTVATAGAMLEVVLERGVIIRVPVGCDEKTLRQLLAVLEEERLC